MPDLTRREFAWSVAGAAAAAPALARQAPAPRRPARASAADRAGGRARGPVAGRRRRTASAEQVTSVDLTRACLARIDVYQPKLNAFITVMREQALARARTLDEERRAGKLRGPLHGIPIAIKDNIDTAGMQHHRCERGL